MIRSIMKKQNKTKEEIEELQRTQVLNLKDVEETVRFEKSISKKPAMIIAIIGAIFLALGSTLQIAKTMKKSVEPKVEKRVISKEKQTVAPVILECQNIQMNNPDGTNITYTINYTFNNYKLTNFTKKYSIAAIEGNQVGLQTIQQYIVGYRDFMNPVNGYTISVTPNETQTVLTAVVSADLEKIDMTTFPEMQKNHISTSIDYQKDTAFLTIQSDMSSKGFTCEQK